MRRESMSEILRPTGRVIKFTQEELEEIERYNVYAEKLLKRDIKKMEEKYKDREIEFIS
ncbi:hypothetical protein MmiHf6_13430 [Methanimicrococcus hongohii]|uniref:Uncharacterized protein n=1 Tax=Methanimicrococcus hongohii TaxID=3028295 RepID=A0AA96V2R9_9EURY|nr:hypothetical protein [Methanimicrococcus sp. Hf6]WNY24018.1 hypothetical protein MmiHf6_13430 [Methanimicrococcus sp. Hf6]